VAPKQFARGLFPVSQPLVAALDVSLERRDLDGLVSVPIPAEADGSSSRPSGLALVRRDAATIVVAWRTATSTRWSSSARA
jgi:hypothetical protein